MGIFRLLYGDKGAINVESSRIDKSRIKVKTNKKGTTKESTIVVFNRDKIREAKKRKMENKDLLQEA